MAGEVRVVEDGIEERPSADTGPSPTWLWLIIGFLAGIGFAVVFLNAPPRETQAGGEAVDFPPAAEVAEDGEPEAEVSSVAGADGIGSLVDGFPDTLVAVAQVSGAGLEYVTWPVSGDLRREPIGGFASQSVRFDVSGWMVALGSDLPDEEGLLLSMGNRHRVRPLTTGVSGYSWHDSRPGELAYTQVDDEEVSLWLARSSSEPELIAAGLEAGSELSAWGDWGFAIQGEGSFTLLSANGEHKAVSDGTALDSRPDGWVAAVDGGLKLVSSGGGIRRLDVDLAPIGDVVTARFSPDRAKLAVVGRMGHLVVSVMDESEVIHAPVRTGFPHVSWTSDSRFLLSPGGRGLIVIDVEDPAHPVVALHRQLVLAAATIPLPER